MHLFPYRRPPSSPALSSLRVRRWYLGFDRSHPHYRLDHQTARPLQVFGPGLPAGPAGGR
jgi:hypothetical protein